MSTPVLRRMLLVHEALDFLDLGAVHGRVVREIEAQPRRFHHAARLFDVRAQHLAQGRVQQVRGGVIAPRGIAQRLGHFGRSTSPTRMGACATNAMHGQPGNAGEGGLHIRHFLSGRGIERAAISHLAAGLRVKRRLIENQLGVRAGGDLVHQLLVHQQADHAAKSIRARRTPGTSCGRAPAAAW